MDNFNDDFINLSRATYLMQEATKSRQHLLNVIANRYAVADSTDRQAILLAIHRHGLSDHTDELNLLLKEKGLKI